MVTIKNRLNITLKPNVEKAIKGLAKKDGVPTATKAAELLELAIEIDEDFFLSKLAEERDKAGTKFISHKEAWKNWKK